MERRKETEDEREDGKMKSKGQKSDRGNDCKREKRKTEEERKESDSGESESKTNMGRQR